MKKKGMIWVPIKRVLVCVYTCEVERRQEKDVLVAYGCVVRWNLPLGLGQCYVERQWMDPKY